MVFLQEFHDCHEASGLIRKNEAFINPGGVFVKTAGNRLAD